jgi:hypothetical protein
VKDWQQQVIRDAADQPEASYAALARWCGKHPDTLLKARRRDPEFDQAITDAREGRVGIDGTLTMERFLREILEVGIKGVDAGGTIFPKVWQHLVEINSGEYSRVLLGGGIGSGKTFIATYSLLYQAARLMSEDDPHASLGLDKGTKVVFAIENKTKRLAERNGFALAHELVQRPKFQALFPTDQRLKSRIVFLKCPVEFWPTSSDGDVLGMTVHSVSIDEANYRDVVARSSRSVSPDRRFDQAQETWEGLDRRVLSRLDEKSGLIIVSSSRRYRGEFLSRLEDELADDPRTYFFNETAWSINAKAFENSAWFSVFIGDQQRPARILSEDEEIHPRDRDLIVRAPQKFHRQFKRNIIRSIQDLAGVAVERVGSYFTDKQALNDAACLANTLMQSSDVTGDAMLLFPGLVDVCLPDSPRAVHADLSLSGDSTGLCVAHIRAFDDQGRPLIAVDGLARIAPPRFGQIDLNSILQLIAGWKQHGVPISYFSCDGFQSADLLQRVQKLGIKVGRISADMTSPTDPTACYESLRIAVVEGRVRFPNDPVVVSELLALEHDHRRNRIDHPPSGSKDSSDALAGAVYQLSRIPAWQLTDRVPDAAYAAAVAHAPLGGQITSIPRAVDVGAMDLIRAERGMPQRY